MTRFPLPPRAAPPQAEPLETLAFLPLARLPLPAAARAAMLFVFLELLLLLGVGAAWALYGNLGVPLDRLTGALVVFHLLLPLILIAARAGERLYRTPKRYRLAPDGLRVEYEGGTPWWITAVLPYRRLSGVAEHYGEVWFLCRRGRTLRILPAHAFRDSEHAIQFAEELRRRVDARA